MYIQPQVQSASYGTTYASSVSATGVEQAVSRASLPPVDETTRNSAAPNRDNPWSAAEKATASQTGTPPAGSAKTATPSATAENPAPGTQSTSSQTASSQTSGTDPDKPAVEEQTPQQKMQAEADQVLLAQLRARDQEVRVHEAAHAAVGGQYAGSASFQYKRGPDGRNYAVGGEVGISTGAVSGDPRATLEKARTIRAAALAPAEPSAQDRRVAAEAAQMELDARTEMRQMALETDAAAEKKRTEAQAETAVGKAEKNDADGKDKSVKDKLDEQTPVAEQPESRKTVPEPVATPNTRAAPATGRDTGTDEESKPAAETEKPAPDARQRLEQILLGSSGILTQANRQGLVNPQNPYGKSGFLDLIA